MDGGWSWPRAARPPASSRILDRAIRPGHGRSTIPGSGRSSAWSATTSWPTAAARVCRATIVAMDLRTGRVRASLTLAGLAARLARRRGSASSPSRTTPRVAHLRVVRLDGTARSDYAARRTACASFRAPIGRWRPSSSRPASSPSPRAAAPRRAVAPATFINLADGRRLPAAEVVHDHAPSPSPCSRGGRRRIAGSAGGVARRPPTRPIRRSPGRSSRPTTYSSSAGRQARSRRSRCATPSSPPRPARRLRVASRAPTIVLCRGRRLDRRVRRERVLRRQWPRLRGRLGCARQLPTSRSEPMAASSTGAASSGASCRRRSRMAATTSRTSRSTSSGTSWGSATTSTSPTSPTTSMRSSRPISRARPKAGWDADDVRPLRRGEAPASLRHGQLRPEVLDVPRPGDGPVARRH